MSTTSKTYRERREAKAERYREWAEKREAKADQSYAGVQAITERIPFGQPILVGHHSERGARADQRRIERGMGSFCENSSKADEMRSKADNIERQAKTAIYSDDEDAIERLAEKLAKLETQREHIKTTNAAFRKDHKAELKAETNSYQRDRMMPFPGYVLRNLGGTITTTRKRLEHLKAQKVAQASGDRGYGKPLMARFAGTCAECGGDVAKGEPMTYYRQTREVLCEGCKS